MSSISQDGFQCRIWTAKCDAKEVFAAVYIQRGPLIQSEEIDNVAASFASSGVKLEPQNSQFEINATSSRMKRPLTIETPEDSGRSTTTG